jgi:hypothetical protein
VSVPLLRKVSSAGCDFQRSKMLMRPRVEQIGGDREIETASCPASLFGDAPHGCAPGLAGVDTVVDTATGPSPDKDAATQFFVTAARNIQDAGEQAGVRRIVVVSIIGCDRFTGGTYGGYYVAKVAQERAHLDGSIPAQILRAAQFHDRNPTATQSRRDRRRLDL